MVTREPIPREEHPLSKDYPVKGQNVEIHRKLSHTHTHTHTNTHILTHTHTHTHTHTEREREISVRNISMSQGAEGTDVSSNHNKILNF